MKPGMRISFNEGTYGNSKLYSWTCGDAKGGRRFAGSNLTGCYPNIKEKCFVMLYDDRIEDILGACYGGELAQKAMEILKGGGTC